MVRQRANKLDDMQEVYRRARDQYLTADDSSSIGIGSSSLGDGGVILVNGGTDESPSPTTMSLAEQKGKNSGGYDRCTGRAWTRSQAHTGDSQDLVPWAD